MRGIVERGPCAPEPPRRARQRLRREPELRQRIAVGAHPRTLEALIAIARILGPAKTRRDERGGKPRLRHVEQRPQHGDAGPHALLGDGGEAVEPAAALEPHEEGLGLIVEVMRGDERRNVMRMAIGGHEVVARLPRALLQAAALTCALRPGENRMGETESLRHARHHRGFLARFGTEPVVDRQHGEVWPCLAFGAPLSHEVEQSHAVGAARHGKRKSGEADQRSESGPRFAR